MENTTIQHDDEAFVKTTDAQKAERFFSEMLGLDTSGRNVRFVRHLENPRKKEGMKLYACKQ